MSQWVGRLREENCAQILANYHLQTSAAHKIYQSFGKLSQKMTRQPGAHMFMESR